MKLFVFSFSKPLMYPFLCPIFNFGQDVLGNKLGFKGHLFMNSTMVFIGEMLSLFLEIISNIKQRTNKKYSSKAVVQDNQLIINSTNEEIDEQLKEKQKGLSILMLLSCLFEFIVNILMSLFLSHPFVYYMIQLECKAFPLFAIAFMNKYIMKVHFEKHNIFAMFIILLGAGSVLIVHFLVQQITKGFIEALIITILFLIVKTVASGKELLDTYILQMKYASPFKLLFYQGLFGFIASSICAIIFNKKDCTVYRQFSFCTKVDDDHLYVEDIHHFISQIKGVNIFLYIIGFLLMVLFLNVFRMQTKVHLTIFHRVLSCITTAIINWFLLFFYKNNDYESSIPGRVVEMIGFIIILFGELVYAEVIICKFKGLDENTKKEILKRDWLERESIGTISQSLTIIDDIDNKDDN